MSDKIKTPVILCAGSDKRQTYAAEQLTRLGKVYCYGTDGSAKGVTKLERLADMPEPADLLVLPVPCNTGLRIPSSVGALNCCELSERLSECALVAGGKLDPELRGCFEDKGFAVEDYFTREELVLRNCIPTVEGALELALRELDVTVSGLSVLIVGWGRVAKACARLFSAVGAEVSVAARKSAALAEAGCEGYKTLGISQLAGNAPDHRLIINTVPAMVITEEVVRCTDSDCLMIDLASKPGGIDFDACDKLRRR
ncbi:MAG: serine carboxypeptidase, partial [Ruminococcus sp.]|nr:serine carboxypeptidase [Ruminococcus sp.]